MRTHLLFAWLFLMLVHLHAVSDQCHLSQQQSLLLKLKDSLFFDAAISKILVTWNESSDYCTWEGVTCEEGCVTGLKLGNESISGGIDNSSILFNLQSLKSLDLSSNNINSSIPSRIGNLTNLSFLNLSNAGFEGQIPIELSHLRRLVALDLSNMLYLDEYLLKLESPNLTSLVQNLTQLEEFYLDGVNISASGKEWVQALSFTLPKLRVLSLAACYLYGPIDQSLSRLKYLSVIRLDFNNFSAPVPRFFANFKNLTSLSLVSCGLYGTFPNEIFQVTTLQTIEIHNELLQGFLPEFPKHSALRSLVITSTSFTGTLPTSIGNLQNLSKLQLSSCLFNGTLPNSMAKLTKLVYLDLSYNYFSGPIPSFSKSLTNIDLSSNRLTGPIPSTLWEGLVNLVDVNLEYNSLGGNIPSSLFSLPSLQTIVLAFNHFSGPIAEFPNASFSRLSYVDLRSNNLNGPIPTSIFKLRKLGTLLLSSNDFNGTIQLHLFRGLGNLWNLDLSHNNLSFNMGASKSNFTSLPKFIYLRLASCNLRTFPDQILKNQDELGSLDLSNNQIDGVIPSWIWKLGNGSMMNLNLSHNYLVGMQEPYSPGLISILDLHSNQLHGSIPVLPPYATYIDLSSNYFTSSMSVALGNNFGLISYISLSNNDLTGVIPEAICDLESLQALYLSNNSLNGRIPTCLLTMSQIFEVNLRGNRLSGSIPDSFSANCHLQTLDLNGNLLTDRIPKSLANCTALEFLDLGNNHLLDTFPMSLKSIVTLRVLVLRSNKLYGHITCSESIGAWQRIQIVDVASNNFSGELPGQCLTKWHEMVVFQNDTNQLFDPRILDSLPYVLHWKYYPSVMNKGLKMELLKIPTGFTAIDFSSNNFHGEVPKELGQLKSLIVLNLSNNALGGQIPSSFGNLLQLESLDLSRNHINGTIPASLSNLNFLSVLNLSYNRLVGRIPNGNQLQTFTADSFQGNIGLCGPPLTSNCTDNVAETSPDAPIDGHSTSGIEIKWNFISFEVGFIVGFGIVIGPLMFWKRWRKYYFDRVEDIAYSILPQLLLRKWWSWKTGV